MLNASSCCNHSFSSGHWHCNHNLMFLWVPLNTLKGEKEFSQASLLGTIMIWQLIGNVLSLCDSPDSFLVWLLEDTWTVILNFFFSNHWRFVLLQKHIISIHMSYRVLTHFTPVDISVTLVWTPSMQMYSVAWGPSRCCKSIGLYCKFPCMGYFEWPSVFTIELI